MEHRSTGSGDVDGVGAVGVGGAGLSADATGMVTISSGDDVLCTVDVTSGSSCAIPGPAAGEYALALGHSGDSNFAPAETTGTLDVARVASQLTTAASS